EKLSNGPAQVDVCSEVTTQSKGADLSRVGGTHSCKYPLYPPRDTAKEFSDPQDLNLRRKEDYEDEGRHSNQVDQHDLSMPVLWREVTVQQSSEDVANSSTVLQAGLPTTRELVAILGASVEAIFLLESWVCEETANEGSVVALHDN